ncbi:MAG: phosphoribosylformylglycinamidine cyclo-ligase [Actinomycetota bacterium]|nr:phosphoribosylformylglycinamidine cyclo-ligase [Actinomycetota bacterium]
MSENDPKTISYDKAGVRPTNIASGMEALIGLVRKTFDIRPVALDLGYYASVIDIGGGQGIAISTDGVGTKILVAEMCGKYDTIGIDCVAMNVNDVICVGATPLSMVDYIAVQEINDELLGAIARGLYKGAELARINIPGGELAQLKEMVNGIKPGYGFDLVGTCIGTVPLNKMLIGGDLAVGDVIIGIAASGIHSNGLTLARRVLFDRMKLDIDSHVAEFGRTVGEELLEPTAIYVPEAMELIASGLRVKSFTHITSDGFLNLTRTKKPAGFRITDLPNIPAIFQVIADGGPVAPEEMWRVFNMGVGFCVVVDPADVSEALEIAGRNRPAQVIGKVVDDPERHVHIEPHGLVGTLETHFQPA